MEAGRKEGLVLRRVYAWFRVLVGMSILCNILTARPSLRLQRVIPPNGSLLRGFLVSRPPGSRSHRNLQFHIERHFRLLGWHFETDRFEEETPIGKVQFTNLIATANPTAQSRIVVAAHYDSKRFIIDDNGMEMGEFIGATDSAWSCALLMELASAIPLNNPHSTLQMIFFDGEEAIKEWNSEDSIYGAKHMAALWSSSSLWPSNLIPPQYKLESIKYMILLDLLGAANPKLYSHYPSTWPIFIRLAKVEDELRRRGSLKTTQNMFITDRMIRGEINGQFIIEDDHVPFYKLGVPVVHLIPIPFPTVWHRANDTVEALDPSTCHDLALTIHTFLINELFYN